ncbi:hypothetical protein SLS58_002909 [Diplodia intermedia]|uniref:Uncharacterized protein n=1 Tax=Diplodia intermedia TaxID=856260 RepID=A0ABR3TYV6_9PEZI
MQPSTILAILSAFTPFAAAMVIDRPAAAPIVRGVVETSVPESPASMLQAGSKVAKTFGSASEPTAAAKQALQRRVAGLPDRMPTWTPKFRHDMTGDLVLDIMDLDPAQPITGTPKRMKCIEDNNGWPEGC